jgi:hypothetical protein
MAHCGGANPSRMAEEAFSAQHFSTLAAVFGGHGFATSLR